MKAIYCNIGKPMGFSLFEKNNAPMGWIRIDILKKQLNEDILKRI